MKIAVVHQKTKFADTKENLKKAGQLIKEAADNNADIINFPEFFTTGFSFSNSLLEDVAESENPLDEIKEMAKRYNIAVGGSYLNFKNDKVLNTYVLAFADGKTYFHSKDIPTVYEGYCYEPGDDERVFHTPLGDIEKIIVSTKDDVKVLLEDSNIDIDINLINININKK